MIVGIFLPFAQVDKREQISEKDSNLSTSTVPYVAYKVLALGVSVPVQIGDSID